MNLKTLTISEVAEQLGVSKDTLRRWDASGKLNSIRNPVSNYRVYTEQSLDQFRALGLINDSGTEEPTTATPEHAYSVVELFAGAGGLGLGLEQAGLQCAMLNEINRDACQNLAYQSPHMGCFVKVM